MVRSHNGRTASTRKFGRKGGFPQARLLRLKLKIAGEPNNLLTTFDTAPRIASLSSHNRPESS